MANVRDSVFSVALWLHNKLGTSNDSWTSGSICSQLNKEVLRNIKDCFPDLQTQVKLKLLLSFFHIPRRLVEEWRTELEEIIEIAGLDTELWVSMIAETIKTFPSSGSLNTEISDYEETRPIFTDMVNDLRKLINKHSDNGMLPLECQYLNKAALVSVVGQQAPPVKHFTIKKKPKSASIKAELLQKCSDAQSVKKTSAPTIPLRSRGMPRKMTDTTPLKGIPSRVPSGGFRTPTSTQTGQNRPNMSRTPAGRKDGGIKLLDITEQPLGYAAAKKRKRQQELEDQQKRALEALNNAPIKQEVVTPVSTTPDYAVGLNATPLFTPAPVVVTTATTNITTSTATVTVIKETVVSSNTTISSVQQPPPLSVGTSVSSVVAATTTGVAAAAAAAATSSSTIQFAKTEPIKMETPIIIKNEIIKSEDIVPIASTATTIFTSATPTLQQLHHNNQLGQISSASVSTLNNNQQQIIFMKSTPIHNTVSQASSASITSSISQPISINSIKQEPRIISMIHSTPTMITTATQPKKMLQSTLLKSVSAAGMSFFFPLGFICQQ